MSGPAVPPGTAPSGRRSGRARWLVALAMTVLPLAAASRPAAAQSVERGEEIYRRWCVECHGEDGKGDGPAADRMLPRPRDFTQARYQVRTTASGRLPTDADLHRVIRDGMPSTTMPGWPQLNRSQREDLIAYLKSLSRFFGQGREREPMDLTEDPGGGEEAVEAGREVYEQLECYRCHGQEGRGDGTSAPTLDDDRGFPVRAADLTQPWLFNGGSSVEAIHTRFLTGMDGTPMPTQADVLAADLVSERDLWNLAHYVRSLGPERVPPRVRDAVRVVRVEGALPEGPDDAAWDEIPRYYFPLSGQVIERPRQFEPMVDGVWVQGAHDGSEVVLRVTWNDPSASPNSAWMEWQRSVAEHGFADGTPIPTDSLPDRLAVQFPVELTAERGRPYFLMGSAQRPVYLWRWNSLEGFRESTATGLGTSGPLPESRLEGSAAFRNGQWRATFRRALDGEGQRITFPEGRAVPVAFYAWDGNNGENATRGAISSWYFLVLEVPTGESQYLVPLVAVLFTGLIGVLATRRARSEGEGV